MLMRTIHDRTVAAPSVRGVSVSNGSREAATAKRKAGQARERARAPSSRTPRRRKPPSPKVAERPHVVVLGRSTVSKRVVRAIRELGIQARRSGSPSEVETSLDDHTKALFIVPPIPSFSVSRLARELHAAAPSVPVFIVMEGTLPSATVRTLYRNGVEAVFEWPVDRQAIRRTSLRLATPDRVRWGRAKTPAEVALEESARAHLEADAVPLGAELGVEATNRFLLLKGSLDALWKLELARQVVSEVPGVEDVIAHGVEVASPEQNDRSIARAVREVLHHARAVEGSTLAIAVRSGEVTLTGSVRDKREAERVKNLIAQVRGVRDIDDYLVVSPRGKRHDKALAKDIQRAVDTRFPDLPLRVSAFGSVAVVAGRVPDASVRDRITRLIGRQEGVQRVVDKTYVRRRRAR